MELKDQLKALAPAVGDGKVIPHYAYVMQKSNRLHVGDGRHFASMPNPAGGRWCVRFEPLWKACQREGSEASVSSAGNVVVKYGAGRITLRTIDSDAFAFPEPRRPGSPVRLPDDFKDKLKAIRPFVGDYDGQIWTQGIHLGPDFVFTGNGKGLVRFDWTVTLDTYVPLPLWAADFIIAQDTSPRRMRYQDNLVLFEWENQLLLHTTLLSQEAPEAVFSMVTNIERSVRQAPAMPREFHAAVQHFAQHEVSDFRAKGSRLWHEHSEYELEEDAGIGGPTERVWPVHTLLTATFLATHLDLTHEHAFWKGDGFMGIVAGMRA